MWPRLSCRGSRHLREARPLLVRALEGGGAWRPLDYYTMWFYSSLVTHDFASGEPLAEVQREAEEARRRLTKRDAAGALLDVMTGQRGLIRTLRGLTPMFGSFDDEEVDEHQLAQHLESDPDLTRPACWYCIRKLQAYVYAAEYDRAAAMAARAQPSLWTATADFLEAEYPLSRGTGPGRRRRCGIRRGATRATRAGGRSSPETSPMGRQLP